MTNRADEHPSPAERRPRRRVGVTGLVVTTVGLVLCVVSFTTVAWLHFDYLTSDGSSIHSSFDDLRQAMSVPGAPALPHLYFGGLAWAALGVTTVLAVASAFDGPYRRAFGLVGFLAGLAGVLLSLLTMVKFSGGAFSAVVKHEFSVGPWLAFAGFFVLAAGSLIGWAADPEPEPAVESSTSTEQPEASEDRVSDG